MIHEPFLPNDSVNTQPLQAFIKGSVGDESHITEVSGGSVHHVYRVDAPHTAYYLKIRGQSFSRVPNVKVDPSDIRYEEKALRLCSTAMPNTFPSVVAYDEARSALLMTDVLQKGGRSLESILDSGDLSLEVAKTVGKTLGQAHIALSRLDEAIRDDGDNKQYERNLRFRLSKFNYPSLDETVTLLRNQPRQLILGDVCPKNIGVRVDGSISFFDLEQVHKGNPVFDLGFLLGHIPLHTQVHSVKNNPIGTAVLQGYLDENDIVDADLLTTIASATVLYRLQNDVIPYTCALNEQERSDVIAEARGYLTRSAEGTVWERV